MPSMPMAFGLSLTNRSVVLGTKSPRQLIELAKTAESSHQFDSVWVGDSLFVNRRLDSVTLLSALAASTNRLLLGPACMGSFALRNPLAFAYEWASLDRISEGRTCLIACSGGGPGPLWEAEAQAMGATPNTRRQRVIENIEILRLLWSEDDVSYEGRFTQFRNVTLEPKPLQAPCPIWLATNADRLSLSDRKSDTSKRAPSPALERVGRIADGWMTHSATPEQFQASWQIILQSAERNGRDPSNLGNCIYHNINVSDSASTSLAEAKRFLDAYYETDFSLDRVKAWTAFGTPSDCIENLSQFIGSGVQRIALRLCADEQFEQLDRVINEVLPFVTSS